MVRVRKMRLSCLDLVEEDKAESGCLGMDEEVEVESGYLDLVKEDKDVCGCHGQGEEDKAESGGHGQVEEREIVFVCLYHVVVCIDGGVENVENESSYVHHGVGKGRVSL